jgi:hypothetical protein
MKVVRLSALRTGRFYTQEPVLIYQRVSSTLNKNIRFTLLGDVRQVTECHCRKSSPWVLLILRLVPLLKDLYSFTYAAESKGLLVESKVVYLS